MPQEFPHLRQYMTGGRWAVDEEHAPRFVAVIERRLSGVRLGAEEIAALKGSRLLPNGVLLDGAALLRAMDDDDGDAPRRSRDAAATIKVASGGAATARGTAVGVIRISGVIAEHARQVDDVSGPGGTSTERIAQALRQALADPNIDSIVFDVDSPGGNVFGVQALADEIFAARGRKRMVAVANSLMASAAYWIASAADEIVVKPGGQVGSIGVVALHEDISEAAAKVGVKYTFITAGKYKVEGNRLEPLGEEARSAIQRDVDAYYRDFVKAVARNRGVKVADVVNGFGQARTVKDADAVSEKMADRVDTLDATLNRMMRGGGKKSGPRAMVPGFSAEELGAPGDAPEPPTPPDVRAPDAPADGAPGDAPAPAPAPPEAPENDADAAARESDAYRRRRHAYLMRRHQ